MKPKQFKAFLAVALFATLDIFFVVTNNQELRLLSKPLIIPSLIGVYLFSFEKENYNWKNDMILLGLCASWIGDILLQFKGLFIPGLVSFLTAHIFYISFLIRTRSEHPSFFKLRPVMLIAVLAYLIELMNVLWPYLGNMKIPVVAYGITISTMLSTALWQYQKLDNKTALYFIIGAISFVLSDSLLAVDKFKGQFAYSGIMIMTTYIIAQLFIVLGAIRYNNSK